MDIMKDFETGYGDYLEMYESMKKHDPITQKVLLCTLIDHVAVANGQSSVEMIQEILPLIESVNNDLGAATNY